MERADKPSDIDLLVTAGFLYPVDGERDVIPDAEIAIRKGAIVYAGPAKPQGHWAPKETLGGSRFAALPGFVNAHCHTASTVFRAQTDDGVGGRGLYTIGFRGESLMTPEDWRLQARLGVAEMIQAGVTTLNDFWYAPDAMGELALETGLRMQIACEICDVDKTRLADGDYTRDAAKGERLLAEGVGVVERWHGKGDGLVEARLGPHAVDTCSAGLHRETTAEARRRGIGLHCHTAQSAAEVAQVKKENGLSSAAWLAEIGVLGPDWVLAHLTFCDEADRSAIAETGAAYAHCATIYPRRGVYPPLQEIRAKGIRTGLATDWMQNDPFEAMRTALNVTRVKAGRHDALTCMEALEMATAGAAEALGLGGRVGRLAEGYDADLILVDLDRPHLQPFYGTPPALVYNARACDVVSSVVRGRVAMRDREIPGLDVEADLAAVKARAPHWGGVMRSLGGDSRLPSCPCGMH